MLYAREFTVDQTLRLWDALFADSANLELIDYIFVAMLSYYKDVMLTGDSMECMRLLMKPFSATGEHVHTIVEHALHIRDPTKYPRPPNGGVRPADPNSEPPASSTPSGDSSRSNREDSARRSSLQQQRKSVPASPRQMLDLSPTKTLKKSTSMPLPPQLERRGSQPTEKSKDMARSDRRPASVSSLVSVSSGAGSAEPGSPQSDDLQQLKIAALDSENAELRSEVDLLRHRVKELEAINAFYCEQLAKFSEQLQKELLTAAEQERAANPAVVTLAIAGISEARAIISGATKPGSRFRAKHPGLLGDSAATPSVTDSASANSLGDIEMASSGNDDEVLEPIPAISSNSTDTPPSTTTS